MGKLGNFGLVFCSWILIIQTSLGEYDVTVRLLEYNRDQDCHCDSAGFFFGGSCHECDVFFQICIQPLSPTQRQICQGNNQDYRVEDTHHFLFSNALPGHDTFKWSNFQGKSDFQISVHAFDYNSLSSNADLGVTSYTYRGNGPTIQTVTTTPGNKNMRIKLIINATVANIQTSTKFANTTTYRTPRISPTTTTTTTTSTTIPRIFTTPTARQTTTTPRSKMMPASPMARTTTPHRTTTAQTSTTCSGEYDVSVRLLEYNRDKDCGCDSGTDFWNCHECDVFFKICLQPLLPTLGQICQGNNQDYRVDGTHHFLFSDALPGHEAYRWSNLDGQPSFEISVHAFDYDPFGDDDDLGVTSYTYRGNGPTVQTVTTTPGGKNMRVKLSLKVSYISRDCNRSSSSPLDVSPTTTPNVSRDSSSSVTSADCVDLHDSCSSYDLVYGICHASPHDSPLLYKQAYDECKRTCKFC